jgi:hypothetical protein
MKSVVTKNLRCWLLLIALFTQPIYASAENCCDCPDPPGGRIACEDHQVGTCGVKNGKVYGGVQNPSKVG